MPRFPSPSSRRAWIEIQPAGSGGTPLSGSPSSRRAWIEISRIWASWGFRLVALLAEGVDRNRDCPRDQPAPFASPSSRRAWIEIGNTLAPAKAVMVALLAEGVDRNTAYPGQGGCNQVALLAEGVDRNSEDSEWNWEDLPSPSSRRAWIEMHPQPCPRRRGWGVALLAEGVDRNIQKG